MSQEQRSEWNALVFEDWRRKVEAIEPELWQSGLVELIEFALHETTDGSIWDGDAALIVTPERFVALYLADGLTEDDTATNRILEPLGRFLGGLPDQLLRQVLDVAVSVDQDELFVESLRDFVPEKTKTVVEYKPRPRISDKDRAYVLARDGHQCLACGATEDLQLDHIRPTSKGGSDHVDNLQTLCGPCNRDKGTKTKRYARRREEDTTPTNGGGPTEAEPPARSATPSTEEGIENPQRGGVG